MGKTSFSRWLVNRAGLLLLGLMSTVVLPLSVSAEQAAPVTAARFSITIDGVEIASFKELSGITTEVTPVEKLSGKDAPSTLTLKRGKNQSMELWAWHEAVLQGHMAAARKSASLVMYNSDGKPVARYHLENAWPSSVQIGALKAGSNEVLMESVTITAERIQRVSP